MELPGQYFPDQICPYFDETMRTVHERKRFVKFTDCGSHGAVNISVDESSRDISFYPQYGQRGIPGLPTAGGSLPLLDKPIKGDN